MKTFKTYKSMPPEKLIKEMEAGNIQVTTKGIRDWIKFIMFLVLLILQGAGIYYAIKLELQSLSINMEYIKTKNTEQDAEIKDLKQELKNLYQYKK